MDVRAHRRIERDVIRVTLELHERAYALLMWLGDRALAEPALFSRECEAALASPDACLPWLREQWPTACAHLLPTPEHEEAFASLFASFFHTSFHIERLEWEGRIVEAHVQRGPGHAGARAAKRARHGGRADHEALHRLCRDEGLRVSEKTLRAVARVASSQASLQIWSYAVGLVRRSQRGGEGMDDWKRWRSIDRETRGRLDVDAIWAARSHLRDQIVRASRDAEG